MAKVIMINTKTRTIRVENADKNIDWITVKGTHVPIEKGQSKSAAVKSFVESKRGDSKEKEFIARKTKEWADKSATAKARTETGKAWRNGELDDKQFIAKTNKITEKEQASKQQPAKKERSWQRGDDEDEDAYYERRDKTLAEARKLDKVSDWYGKAYKGDSFGKPKNKNITFKELADGLLSGKIGDFDEAVGTGESDVREKIFQELSERTGRPYDDFYDAWLHGGQKGTSGRAQKQKESVAYMDKLLELNTDMDPELRKMIVAARDRAKKELKKH